MNIRFMRWVDYRIGRPLCLALRIINFFSIIKFIKRKREIPRAVLFIKLSELGAIILSYPLLRRIKQEYPAADLFFVTFKKNKDIFKALGEVIPDKNILVIRDSLFGFSLDLLGAIIKLRFKKIDLIFDLEFFSRFSAIFAYLVASPKRVGFFRYNFEGLYRGNLLTHRVLYNPLGHIARNYLSLAQAVRLKKKKAPELEEKIEEASLVFPAYAVREEIKERMRVRLGHFGVTNTNKLFLINPGEGVLALREWPLDYFIALCTKILEDTNNYLVLIGARGACAKAGQIPAALNNNPRCINLTGQTTLDELFNLFCLADALVSSDCGLAHLAMLAPVKKFIIFGPESPQAFGPLGKDSFPIYSDWPCSPCLSVLNHRASSCKDNLCLKAIKPEYVYGLIRDNGQKA